MNDTPPPIPQEPYEMVCGTMLRLMEMTRVRKVVLEALIELGNDTPLNPYLKTALQTEYRAQTEPKELRDFAAAVDYALSRAYKIANQPAVRVPWRMQQEAIKHKAMQAGVTEQRANERPNETIEQYLQRMRNLAIFAKAQFDAGTPKNEFPR